MKEHLTAKDVEYIAEGCWNHNFNWKFHAKVKLPLLIALITFIAGLATLFADLIDRANAIVVQTGPSAITFVAIALILIAAGFFVRAIWISSAEKAGFIDYAIEQWENGQKGIPNADTVIKYIKGS